MEPITVNEVSEVLDHHNVADIDSVTGDAIQELAVSNSPQYNRSTSTPPGS